MFDDSTIISTTNYNLREFGISEQIARAQRGLDSAWGELYIAILIPSVIIARPHIMVELKCSLSPIARLNATDQYLEVE